MINQHKKSLSLIATNLPKIRRLQKSMVQNSQIFREPLNFVDISISKIKMSIENLEQWILNNFTLSQKSLSSLKESIQSMTKNSRKKSEFRGKLLIPKTIEIDLDQHLLTVQRIQIIQDFIGECIFVEMKEKQKTFDQQQVKRDVKMKLNKLISNFECLKKDPSIGRVDIEQIILMIKNRYQKFRKQIQSLKDFILPSIKKDDQLRLHKEEQITDNSAKIINLKNEIQKYKTEYRNLKFEINQKEITFLRRQANLIQNQQQIKRKIGFGRQSSVSMRETLKDLTLTGNISNNSMQNSINALNVIQEYNYGKKELQNQEHQLHQMIQKLRQLYILKEKTKIQLFQVIQTQLCFQNQKQIKNLNFAQILNIILEEKLDFFKLDLSSIHPIIYKYYKRLLKSDVLKDYKERNNFKIIKNDFKKFIQGLYAQKKLETEEYSNLIKFIQFQQDIV